MDQNTATILSTLLGGILTASGGFIANYYLQKTSHEQLKRKETKEIMEKLYSLAEETRDLFSTNILCVSLKREAPKEAIEIIIEIYNKLDQITRTVKLYMSSLENEAKLYRELVSNQTPPLHGALLNKNGKDLSEIYSNVYDATNQFIDSISKLAKKKGYDYF